MRVRVRHPLMELTARPRHRRGLKALFLKEILVISFINFDEFIYFCVLFLFSICRLELLVPRLPLCIYFFGINIEVFIILFQY